MIAGVSDACMSSLAKACGLSSATAPPAILVRRLVPSDAMMRIASATGLKSTVTCVPAAGTVFSVSSRVATPVCGSMVATVPSSNRP